MHVENNYGLGHHTWEQSKENYVAYMKVSFTLACPELMLIFTRHSMLLSLCITSQCVLSKSESFFNTDESLLYRSYRH